MKTLIIGCGGIGSFVCQEIAKQIEHGQLQFDELIDIADNDMAELEQVRYQNFMEEDAGKNKAEALAERCTAFGFEVFKAVPERIHLPEQLEGYDFFVLCVDNDMTRALVVEYCHKKGREFIDLRATGRRIFFMPKERKLSENMKFLDITDTEEYSCQDRDDLDRGYIQLGNKIVALIGVQALMNFQRGHTNRTMTIVV